jgi:hypothetical protein
MILFQPPNRLRDFFPRHSKFIHGIIDLNRAPILDYVVVEF